ncbi:MAG: sugar ABC transporter permease [Ilumatobacteraceae bacterium]
MVSVLWAIVFTAVAIGALLAVLGGFYWLTNFLPTKRQEAGRAWVFAFPAVFLLSVGLLVPAVRTIYLSFFDDNMKGFVGLDNYKTIATTQGTRLTVFNSLAWVIVGTIVTCIVGLAIARFADGMRGEKIAKSLIFLPGAISLVGAGVVWKFVYADNSQLGLLNQVTKVIPGLPNSLGGNGRATGCSSAASAGSTRPARFRASTPCCSSSSSSGLRPASPPWCSRPRSRESPTP